MFIKFSAKAQGKSHIEKNIPCQDAAEAILGSNIGMAFVADGHGGAKYFRSERGSELAVSVARKSLYDFYGKILRQKTAFFDKKAVSIEQKNKEITDFLKQLEGNIIYQWRNSVIEHLNTNPLTDAEKEICISNKIDMDDPSNLILLYGTTLLAAFMSGSFWFVLQIGDGLIVVLDNDGIASLPVPEDERLAFGRTTSLCDSDAIKNFRENFGFESIKGITVATDGVADSFEPEKYLRFNEELLEKFTHIPVKAEADLQEFLPRLSERGSGDDVAITGIFRQEEC
ncbi:protein phosphatase 2C domain-containing protein [Treponema sp. TIM-1]|uniref:PP2C family serine/threonine-protein phosphatase n=1 Tax=Treponema sp. TIM-1 TaxID=2898417 RepID=UPI003980D390